MKVFDNHVCYPENITMMQGRRETPSILVDNFHHVYTGYYLEILREKEAKRSVTTLQSKQLIYRGSLILKLKSVSSRMGLGSKVLHSGVQILDIVMDAFDVKVERLVHVALICLLLAAKFEMKGIGVPRFSQICRAANEDCMLESELCDLELRILKHLNWNLCCPTVVTFLGLFFPVATTLEDYKEWQSIDTRNNKITYDKFKLLLKNEAKAYTQLTLSCMKLSQIAPSLLAAGCIQASRMTFGLNTWTRDLCIVTKYEPEVVINSANTLRKMMLLSKKQKYSDPDSGFSTTDSGLSTTVSGRSSNRSRVSSSNSGRSSTHSRFSSTHSKFSPTDSRVSSNSGFSSPRSGNSSIDSGYSSPETIKNKRFKASVEDS